jgi:hypothetical protein
VLLNFIATYSATSKKEVVAIEKLYQKFKEKDQKKENAFIVLGITSEKDKVKVKSFATQSKITYPILIEASKTFKDYKVNQLPTIFYINKDGIIYSVHSGPVTSDEKMMDAEIAKVLANTPVSASATTTCTP